MNQLVVIYLACIYLINQATSFSCYQCNSNNEEICNSTQTIAECSREYNEDSCVTVSYTNVLRHGDKRISRSYFRKFCANKQSTCSYLCRSLEETNHRHCKVACCYSSLCNEPVKRSEIFFGVLPSSEVRTMAGKLTTLTFITFFFFNLYY